MLVGNHNNKFFKYCKKIFVMLMLMEPELYIINYLKNEQEKKIKFNLFLFYKNNN